MFYCLQVNSINIRNSVGKKIVEGLLKPEISKLEKYVKNFKHVASLIYLHKNEKTNKIEVGRCKVPFAREDDIKEFEKTFHETIKLIK